VEPRGLLLGQPRDVSGVVDDHVQHEPHLAAVEIAHQSTQRAGVAQLGLDGEVVRVDEVLPVSVVAAESVRELRDLLVRRRDPERVNAQLGEVVEVLADPLLAGKPPRFAGVSRMPVVRRDLALIVAEDVPAGALVAAARSAAPAFVREVEVFDQYRGKGVEPGKKSLALRIVMQDTDRTLTDSEVEEIVASIREQLSQQFKAKPRT